MEKNLNYMNYEKIFREYCRGTFNPEIESIRFIKANADNVDKYILLCAAMNESEKQNLIGEGDSSIDAATLSRYRKGGRKIADDIQNTFRRKDSLKLIQQHFQRILPSAISKYDHYNLLKEIWNLTQDDLSIPAEIREQFNQEYSEAVSALKDDNLEESCLFLAHALEVAILREDYVKYIPHLSRDVEKAIRELENNTVSYQAGEIFREMCRAALDGTIDEHKNAALKQVNDSRFTDDDYKYFALAILKCRDKMAEDELYGLRILCFFSAILEIKQLKTSSIEGIKHVFEKYEIPKESMFVIPIDEHILSGRILQFEAKLPRLISKEVVNFDDMDEFLEQKKREGYKYIYKRQTSSENDGEPAIYLSKENLSTAGVVNDDKAPEFWIETPGFDKNKLM